MCWPLARVWGQGGVDSTIQIDWQSPLNLPLQPPRASKKGLLLEAKVTSSSHYLRTMVSLEHMMMFGDKAL